MMTKTKIIKGYITLLRSKLRYKYSRVKGIASLRAFDMKNDRSIVMGNWVKDQGNIIFSNCSLILMGIQQYENMPPMEFTELEGLSILDIYIQSIYCFKHRVQKVWIKFKILQLIVKIQNKSESRERAKQDMKQQKSKKTTSFISNQQLIENMRNKSTKNIFRNDSKQRNKQKSKSRDKLVNISLIEPKNYNTSSIKNILHNYEGGSSNNSFRINNCQSSTDNNSMRLINNYCDSQNINPNIQLKIKSKNHTVNSKVHTSHSEADQGKQSKPDSLLKFLKQNISNKKLISQVQNLLDEQYPEKKTEYNISKQQAALLAKIQELYIQKTRLKRQKKQAEQKFKEEIKQFAQREELLKKQNQRLHKLVLKQSEMITNQASSQLEAAEDLRRILLTQAKTIEGLEGMGKKSRTSASSSVIKSR